MRATLEVLPLDTLYREIEQADRNAAYYCCETRRRWLRYHEMIVEVIKERLLTATPEDHDDQ